MKKEDLYTYAVYALMLGLALFVGLEIIAPAFSVLGIVGSAQYVYALVTIVIGFIINATFLELGHICGALIGGYRIQSTNILGFSLYKDENKWKFGMKSFEGLTGETIVLPKNSKSQPILNLWGGLIFYVMEVILGFLLAYTLFTAEQWGRYAVIIIIAIGGMLMIYNFMPFKMDTITDGYRLATTPKGKGNDTFNELIRIEQAYASNEKPGPFKTFTELNNGNVQVLIHEIYDQIKNKQYKEALINIQKIRQSTKLSETILNKSFSMEAYVYLLSKTQSESASWFYDLSSKERKFISNDGSLITLCAYILVAGTIEDSFSEAAYCYDRRPSAMKKTTDKNLLKLESSFFEASLAVIKTRHPDWIF